MKKEIINSDSNQIGAYINREHLENFYASILPNHLREQSDGLPETLRRWLDRRYKNCDAPAYLDCHALNNFLCLVILSYENELKCAEIEDIQVKYRRWCVQIFEK